MGHLFQKLYSICGALAGADPVHLPADFGADRSERGGAFRARRIPSTIPSYGDFSGFMLAGATFLALAHTLRAGGHIRVNLVTARMPLRAQVVVEAAVLLISAALAGYLTWFMIDLTLESLHYNDLSTGIVPVPLWIPQSVATFGMALFLIAILHTLADLVRAGRPVLTTPDEV